MSVQTIRKASVVEFKAANRNEVQRFIDEHADAKSDLIVEINGAGIGDCWADSLEAAGFIVRRFYSPISSVSSKRSA